MLTATFCFKFTLRKVETVTAFGKKITNTDLKILHFKGINE